MQRHVSISLLAVVSHQSDPHHLMKREVETTSEPAVTQQHDSESCKDTKLMTYYICRNWFGLEVWFI